LYLIAPLFSGAKKPVYRYIFGVWFVSLCCTFSLAGFLNLPLNGNFTGILPTYLGYFVAGYLLHGVILTGKKLFLAWIVLFVMLGITIGGTGWFTLRNNGVVDGFFYNYLNVTVVAMTMCVFLLLKTWGQHVHPIRMSKTIHLISAHSLGIYAFHPLLLEWLSSGNMGIKLNASFIHPLLGIPLTFAVIVIISTGAIFLLSKIPLVKKMV
jgi:surface polysaccharide O-acyltransferase-like enzyme